MANCAGCSAVTPCNTRNHISHCLFPVSCFESKVQKVNLKVFPKQRLDTIQKLLELNKITCCFLIHKDYNRTCKNCGTIFTTKSPPAAIVDISTCQNNRVSTFPLSCSISCSRSETNFFVEYIERKGWENF